LIAAGLATAPWTNAGRAIGWLIGLLDPKPGSRPLNSSEKALSRMTFSPWSNLTV
jgi:hypothetical protein